MSAAPQSPQIALSPSRLSSTAGPPSSAASLPMTYSTDSASQAAAEATPTRQQQHQHQQQQEQQQQQHQGYSQQQPSSPLPPAYALQRSERTDQNDSAPPNGSFATNATTEDGLSIGASTMDETGGSVDYTEEGSYSTDASSRYYNEGRSTAASSPRRPRGNYEAAEGYLDTVTEYQQQQQQQQQQRDGNDNDDDDEEGIPEDATPVIFDTYKKLLLLMSRPELFRDALVDNNNSDDDGDAGREKEGSTMTTSFDKDFADGSATQQQQQQQQRSNTVTKTTQNETFSFDPNANANANDDEQSADREPNTKPKSTPLPHQIFAPDAEVVLPQALTATQLFGVERKSGVELEAAAGIARLSRLFLRWLALMPDGDHDNTICPPGLTVMKIGGGGYRVTGAHRVVWRWMNKFSFAGASPKDPVAADSNQDFDFGDLVTMTIIDVFETDARGKLLSYCPTFDNRAVHRTPEMAERLRKGAGRLKERMDVVARSPAGKSATKAAGSLGRMAMVVGNAVKNKMQHNKNQNYSIDAGADSLPEEDQLNELLESQIAIDEESADFREEDEDSSGSEEDDTTASLGRRMEV